MDEKELLKIAVKLNSKKVKSDFKNQVKIFDELKGILGASSVERMKLPMEFENDKDYMEYIKEYIKKHTNDITNFSNRILFLNERIRVSENEDDILELYGILLGFVPFLMIKGLSFSDE